MEQSNWRFAHIWNDSLLTFGERPMVPRDYIYASELGGSYIDRYLKMLGTKPTNPPNNRSLRKFQAGNIWEAIIGYVLLRAGILKKKQVQANVQLPGCCSVHGRLDFIAGGEVDFERAEHELKQLDPFFEMFPPFLQHATREIIAKLKYEYAGKLFLEKITEVKSVGSFVYERAKKVNTANPNHMLQNFHYLIGTEYSFGSIVYVCRDDARLLEFPLFKSSSDIMDRYEADVSKMSEYYIHKELPPKENLVLFDDQACRFTMNWKVEYSYYLTKLYKYDSPKDYRDHFKSMVTGFNYAFKRCVDGANLTENNRQKIKEAKKMFPEWDKYVVKAKEVGVLEVVEEEDE